MTRQKHNLPPFVQPYSGGKFKVIIARRHLRYNKSGFDTPQAAHAHAIEVLGQTAETVIAAQPERILAALGYSCQECGYSQAEPFFKCPKCGGHNAEQDAGPRSIDEIIGEHTTNPPTPVIPTPPVPSCTNCLHAGICRLKHTYAAEMLETLKQFCPKMDAAMVRRIMGSYCEYYGSK